MEKFNGFRIIQLNKIQTNMVKITLLAASIATIATAVMAQVDSNYIFDISYSLNKVLTGIFFQMPLLLLLLLLLLKEMNMMICSAVTSMIPRVSKSISPE